MARSEVERDARGGRPVSYATLIPTEKILAANPELAQKAKAAAQQKMVQPFSYQTPRFQGKASPGYNIPNAPAFYASPFQYPRGEDVFNDPSYQFRLNEGMKALERSAAAKGMLRTGNTLQDLMRYGQDYASQEYGKAAERAKTAYDTNLGTSQLMYQPGYATWQARAEAEARQKDAAFDRQWQEYTFRINDQLKREQMLLDAQRGL